MRQLDQLSPESKAALLTELLRRRASGKVEQYGLSHGQQALWFLYRLHPDGCAYNTSLCARIRSGFDVGALRRTFERLLDRHPVLRTTYVAESGVPVQRVQGYQALDFRETDAANWPEAELKNRVESSHQRPFDLGKGPILRIELFHVSRENCVLLITVHHIARDGWSTDILLKEIELLYAAEAGETRVKLPPLVSSYADFVAEQAGTADGPEGARLLAYWRDMLGEDPPILSLFTDRPRPPIRSERGGSVQIHFDRSLTADVRGLARELGVTSFTVLLSCYQLLLYHYTTQREILVGVPAFNRGSGRRFESVIGYFVNPVVIKASIDPQATLRELVSQQHQRVLGALDHQAYPFDLLVRELKIRRDPGRPPLIQTMFNHLRVRSDASVQSLVLPGGDGCRVEFGGMMLEPFFISQEEGQFDLSVDIVERELQFHGSFKYDSDLFDAATIGRMAGHYRALLYQITTLPERRVAATSPLSTSEREKMLVAWNATQTPPPPLTTIQQLFEAQVERTPDVTAVTCEGCRLTYAELDERADMLARGLRELGDGPMLVGIYIESSIAQLVAVLGALKSGGAFVPLDPGYPAERIAFIARDAGLSLLLTDGDAACLLREHVDVVRDINALMQSGRSGGSAGPEVTQGALAYISYTSGSTGQPKGVKIAHASVLNLLAAMQRRLGMDASDRLLSVTSLSFDIALLELLLPLAVGGQVEIAGRALARDAAGLAARLDRGDLTAMQATPTTWTFLVDAGWRGRPGFKALCGGEAMSRTLADALRARTECVWNLYGPTETTIWSAIDRVRTGEKTVPIGRPIDNTRIYILNEHRMPAPAGVAGELYIAGAGLALGYHNRPELTAERFPENPFDPGTRMYATGDLARYRDDGRIEFLGRNDSQVKLHGHRIELSEIEATLLGHPAVSEAVVVRKEGDGRVVLLVAYCVLRNAAEVKPTTADLHRHLESRLPGIMIPSALVLVDALPLTPNGKVDRKALMETRMERLSPDFGYISPRDTLESLLCDLWCRVLGLDRCGVRDNFFELGGASIQCIKLVSLATRAGLRMNAEDVFRHQTIEALAQALKEREPVVIDPLHSHDLDVSVPASLIAEHAWLSREIDGHGAAGANAAPATVVIESLGTYLPARVVSTADILGGCLNPVEFDLERMTGIQDRRKAAPDEFSLDLAGSAIVDCLSRSRHGPRDIDLLICCNISRFDGLRRITFEPATAIRLKRQFGFDRARTFDVSNACTGMFTALAIVDVLMRNGAIDTAMIVSGEYITHLTDNAQIEIEGVLDPRLACLTVGDAGAALILERSASGTAGFHDIDLFTLGSYSHACVAKPTDGLHGGAIMFTDSLNMTEVGIRQGLGYSLETLVRSRLPVQAFDHFLMHQTSSTTIRNAMREINLLFGREVCHAGNTIDNLAHRGNTATTAHFVALMDQIKLGRIHSGDRIFFSVSGSGITLGTALYTLDDLPDRIRGPAEGCTTTLRSAARSKAMPARDPLRVRVRFAGIGLSSPDATHSNTIALLGNAARSCLAQANRAKDDVELLIHAGVYRRDFVCEPAIAALVAGDIDANATQVNRFGGRRTLAFDVFNGGIGFLDACDLVTEFFAAGAQRTALITAGDVDNNREIAGQRPAGIAESGSAAFLEVSSSTGLGRCLFRGYTQWQDGMGSHCTWNLGKPHLELARAADLEECYLDAICDLVPDLLALEGIEPGDLSLLIPPQISSAFIRRLGHRLQWPDVAIVDVCRTDGDLLTSSTPAAMKHILDNGLASEGDLGLIVNVGSGLQVACALYRF